MNFAVKFSGAFTPVNVAKNNFRFKIKSFQNTATHRKITYSYERACMAKYTFFYKKIIILPEAQFS